MNVKGDSGDCFLWRQRFFEYLARNELNEIGKISSNEIRAGAEAILDKNPETQQGREAVQELCKQIIDD
jgi:hypothetical protein